MVRVFIFNPKVKGSNLMSDIVCGEHWYGDQIFFIEILK
jgi:hypothetical protein